MRWRHIRLGFWRPSRHQQSCGPPTHPSPRLWEPPEPLCKRPGGQAVGPSHKDRVKSKTVLESILFETLGPGPPLELGGIFAGVPWFRPVTWTRCCRIRIFPRKIIGVGRNCTSNPCLGCLAASCLDCRYPNPGPHDSEALLPKPAPSGPGRGGSHSVKISTIGLCSKQDGFLSIVVYCGNLVFVGSP